jgi:outer membrane protein assembly factor BamB
MKRVILALAAASLVGGCGIFGGKGDKKSTPTVGERIPVLSSEAAIEVDPALAAVGVSVPGPTLNTEWAQPGGNAAKSMGHLALAAAPSQIWRSSIGSGSSTKAQLAAAPVIADGKVFTIDTQAVVRAFNADTGATLWQSQIRGEAASASTGGVSTRPTAPAMPPRSMPPTAASCGCAGRAARSAAPRRSPMTMSMSSARTISSTR